MAFKTQSGGSVLEILIYVDALCLTYVAFPSGINISLAKGALSSKELCLLKELCLCLLLQSFCLMGSKIICMLLREIAC